MSEVKTSNKRRKVEVDPNAPVPDASEFIESFKYVFSALEGVQSKRTAPDIALFQRELGIKLKVDDLKKGLKLLGLCSHTSTSVLLWP